MRNVVLEPAKKLQVIIARGVITGWKMPVYFGCDVPMRQELLMNVVKQMESKGFVVRGCSFDLGNKEFLSGINFKSGTYKIPNPAEPDRSFYFLADIPHMMKLFRNHMFDKGFWFPKDPFKKLFAKPTKHNFEALKSCGDWVPLNKSHFHRILDADAGEFQIHWKLKPLHVLLEAGAKTNVRIAAQTCSASTAAAMRYLDSELKQQADIIQVVNDVSKHVFKKKFFSLNTY